MKRSIGGLALALLGVGTAVSARDYEAQANKAFGDSLPAVSVFVDVDWGGREDGAARELTRAHKAFHERGFVIVDVEGYLENGDLQGFFVTYRRE